MSDVRMYYRPIEDLRPADNNPRKHSKVQIREIARSIEEFGFIAPVLVDNNDTIVAGHARVEAAKMLNIKDLPTVHVAHLSHAQVQAYRIADNRLAEKSEWDPLLLKVQLTELSRDLKYDVTLTGYDTGALDQIILDTNGAPVGEAQVSVERSEPAVSQVGDLWRIGEHAVYCGDSLELASYQALMGNEVAGLVFTDPPYNVRIAGNVSGLGQHSHGEFAMASGEMSKAEFTAFLKSVFERLAQFSGDGALHYICMDWRHMLEVLVAADGVYSELKNLCVWAKTNGGMGNLYRSQHELVFVYKQGTAPHINNVNLGKHGRNRTNLWTYAGANSFGKTRDADLAMHPTVKPVQLVADAILDASNRGDVVLDVFGGSGTTLVAAEQTGRRGRAIEIDPHYVDTIVRRLEKAAGVAATLGDGRGTFDEIRAWRRFLN